MSACADMMKRQNFVSAFLLLSLVKVAATYNLDTEFPVRFDGPKNSYFGYTVALLSNNNAKLVIVGAPRANVTENPKIPEPGAVFQCNAMSTRCSIVPLDPDVDENERFTAGDNSYVENKEKAWLGVSLDTYSEGGGKILACSHLWKNQFYDDQYLANGMCYVINGDLDPLSSTKYGPLIDAKKQVQKRGGDYLYYAGQAGTSAQFAKGAKSMILGAPGIYEWKGSFALYMDGLGGGITKRSLMSKYGILHVPNPLTNVDFGSYFGYAVTSGTFLTDRTYYVIGAPRESYVGKVFIVDVSDEGAIIEKVTKEGQMMGEYFGAAVCAVDVNSDGLDDLMVGAPFYSKSLTNNDGDEGAVYVYINEDLTRLVRRDLLMGSQVPGARFGSTIAAIGDMNMDGYQDIAIGAPYENNVGAVYIYLGSKAGLVVPYVQRIAASMAHSNARGFGISISRGLDIDGNYYPDVAVGAYDSNQAFLFRTRPLIYLEGSISVARGNIDMDTKLCSFQGSPVTCFVAEICLLYHGKHVQARIDVNTQLEVDIYKGNDTKSTRVVIIKDGTYRAQAAMIVQVEKDKKQCSSYDIHVPVPPKDYLTPVTLRLKYSMITSKKVKVFCKSCPVERRKSDSEIAQIRFKKDCGGDDKCDADLQLKTWLDGYNQSSFMTIGASKEVVLQARVLNVGEPAYMTRLFVELPEWMQLNQKPATCDKYGQENNIYICQVANPLATNKSESIQLHLNLENIPLTEKVLLVNVSTMTDSNEENKKLFDNEAHIEVPLLYVADITVRGILESEQILYDLDEKGKVKEDGKVLFSHTYEIANTRPSPVEIVSVHLSIPSLSREDAYATLMTIHSIDKHTGKSLATFGSCDQEVLVSPLLEEFALSQKNFTFNNYTEFKQNNFLRRRRNIEAMDLVNDSSSENSTVEVNNKPASQGYYIINCTTAMCETVVCSVGPFTNAFSASLTVTIEISAFNIKKYMGKKDTAAITTMAQVFIENPQIDTNVYNNAPDKATLTSFLMPRGASPGELPSWVIPVSVVAGLLLLIIIIATLVKTGFFKRKQKEDLEKEKMLHRGEVSSTDPLVDADGE